MNIITLLNAGGILNQFAQIKTTPRLAYKIMKFCKSIETEEEFYNGRRNEIIDLYAQKDENGQPIVENNIVRIIEGKTSEARAAMQELDNMDVEAPNIRFTLDELEGLELSAAEMYALDAFIEE